MTTVVESIRAEYLRYKALAEAAIAQVDEPDLAAPISDHGNSIAVICWHISGNLRSRFTDFLTSDGEKTWRLREEEFLPRIVSREELLAKWDEGWRVLSDTLATLNDEHLQLRVTVRGQAVHVHEALHRSLAHISYHVGQIVYVAKSLRGKNWTFLSIPLGQSTAYNQAPTLERPASQQASLSEKPRK